MFVRSAAALMAVCLVWTALGADAPTLPDGPGRKTVESVCGQCHGLNVVTDKKWNREQWRESVNAMIDRGASLTKEQTADAIDYLARNFTNKDRGRELFEDVCMYCHSLEKVRGQQLSRQAWRDLIKGMIFEGAPVTDEEFSLLVDYLAKNYGKKAGEE